MTKKLVGQGTAGDFVLQNQVLAKEEGFGHVAKHWYKQTISYEQGLEQLELERKQREDIECTLKAMKPALHPDNGVCGFEYEDGRFFNPTPYAWERISVWLGMPTKMPEWYLNFGKPAYSELLYHTLRLRVENSIKNQPDKIFKFRTYSDGTLRTMVSDRYSYVDNSWMIEQLQEMIPGGRLSHWKGNGDTIYGNLLIPDTIREEDDSDYGGMLSLSNCEIGTRVFSQYPSLFRAICMNGCIWSQTKGSAIRQRHNGIDLDELRVRMWDNIQEQIPLMPSIVAQFLALRGSEYAIQKKDNVAAIFVEICQKEKLTTGGEKTHIGKILKEWDEKEKTHRSLFGVINAITRAAQTFNNDDWVKLDTVAGKLAAYSPKDWDTLRTRANALTSKDVGKAYGVSLA